MPDDNALTFPVEAGHIMMFARAVGDPNPIYSDAAYAAGTEPGGIIAPPTFVQASSQFDPNYRLRPRIGEPWFGSGREPTGVSAPPGGGGGGTGLHAEQHYEYHRPVRPGDVLTVTQKPGNTWTREGRRGGTMTFTDSVLEFRDQHGELVMTARGVGVRTSKTVGS
jgi:acyl dehydratase